MLSVDTPNAGLEEIQRAALLVLFDTLNTSLGLVQDSWSASDEAFATRMGRDYAPTTLELVAPENFHEGIRPSLINASIERYPNVSVMAMRAVPGAGTELYDHQEKYRVTLIVEIMVKSWKDELGEEVCNRRAQRMVQAVHTSLAANATLGGIVSGFDGTPSMTLTELFPRKERGGHVTSRGARTSYGPEWLWQGGRLEYAVRKEATLSPSNSFRSVTTYDGLDIDQPL